MDRRAPGWCFACDAPADVADDAARCPRCGGPVWRAPQTEEEPSEPAPARPDDATTWTPPGPDARYGLTLGPDGALASEESSDGHPGRPPEAFVGGARQLRLGTLATAVLVAAAVAVIVVAGRTTTTVPDLAEEPPIPVVPDDTTTTVAEALDPFRPEPATLIYAHGPALPGLTPIVGAAASPPLDAVVHGVVTGGRAVTLTDGTVRVWDPGGVVAVDAPVPPSASVEVAPGGRTIYGLGVDGRPWRWRWDGGLVVADDPLPFDPDPARVRLLVSPSGARVGITDGEATVLWDGTSVTSLDDRGWLVAVGDDRVARWRFDPQIHLEIVHTEPAFSPSLILRTVELRPDAFPVGAGAFDPTGEMLAVVGIRRTEGEPERPGAWLVGVGSGRFERIAREVPARAIAWAGDGSAVYLVSGGDVVAHPVDGSRDPGFVGATPDGRIFVGDGLRLAVFDAALEPRGELVAELEAGSASVGRLALRPSGALQLLDPIAVDDRCPSGVDVAPIVDSRPTYDVLVAHCGRWLLLEDTGVATVAVPPELSGRELVTAVWQRAGADVVPGVPRLWAEVADAESEEGGRVGPLGDVSPGAADREGRSLSVLGGIPLWVADGAVWSPHGIAVAPGSFPGDGVEAVAGIGDALYVAFDNGRGRLQLFRLPEASPQVLQPFPVEPQVGPEGPLFFVAGGGGDTRLFPVPGDELLLWTTAPSRTLVVRLPGRRTPDPCRGRICVVDILDGRVIAVSPDGHWVALEHDGALVIRSLRGRDGLDLDALRAPDSAAWLPSDRDAAP